ncbi:MAG: hypothetical protein RL417_900 [Pseudomonadota bacterium]
MSDRLAILVIVLFVSFVGLLLRVTGMRGDIWFDEAWAIEAVQRLDSLGQLLTIYRHHTNHLLNSFVLTLIPPQESDLFYRIPAVTAALAAIPLFWGFAQRQMGVYAFGAALLFGISVPVIAFSTEARGFGFLVFFALIALTALDANLREEDWRWILVYWVACILAFLSHPTFVLLFSAMIVWSLSLHFSARFTRMVDIVGKCHLAPVAACVLIYLNFYHGVPPESIGALTPFLDSAISAVSLAVGGPEYVVVSPEQISLARLIAGIAAILVLIELYLMVIGGARYWMLYLGGCFVAPYLWYLSPLVRTNSVAYFLLPTVLLYGVLGSLLTRLLSTGLVGRAVALGLLGVCCYGSISQLDEAFGIGRGKVRRAFEYMAENSEEEGVVIAGDDDIGNELLVSYYIPRLKLSKPLVYLAKSEPAAGGAEWYLVKLDRLSEELDHEVVMMGDRRFELKKVFRRRLPSGTNLLVYQRVSG